MALPDTDQKPPDPEKFPGRSAAKTVINQRLSQLTDNQLIAAFRADPYYILRQTNWLKLDKNNKQKRRLNKLIQNNPQLKPILEQTLARLSPPTQTQAQAEAKIKAKIPEITAESLIEPNIEKPTPSENYQKVVDWMNNLKPEFQKFLAARTTKKEAALYSADFTRNFWSFLSIYRGRLASYYLSQGTRELVSSALGPVGNVLREMEQKKIDWHMWKYKHSLSYWYQSWPTTKAVELIRHPISGAFGLLQKGGAPLISTTRFETPVWNHKIQRYDIKITTQKTLTPILRAIQASHTFADKLDVISGIPTSNLPKGRNQYSPSESYIKNLNNQLAKNLSLLDQAKKSGDKKEAKKAINQLNHLLNQNKGILKRVLNRTARRARNTHKDPLTFLASLIMGLAWDATIGLVLNSLRVLITKTISKIPLVAATRAKLAEFFTSNRWLTTARVGGTTFSNFVRGTFSPTTASSAFLGTRLASLAANIIGTITGNQALGQTLVFPFQVTFGASAGALGAIYNTALKIATHPRSGPFISGWVAEYDRLYQIYTKAGASSSAASQRALNLLNKRFIRPLGWGPFSGKPGPITRLSRFLHQKWWVRLPLNGGALGLYLAPALEQTLGWNQTATIFGFVGADWLWQTKGSLSRLFTKKWFQPTWNFLGKTLTSPYGKWLQPTWKFLRWEFISPRQFIRNLTYKFYYKWAYSFNASALKLIKKPWWRIASKNWQIAKPYLRNFFNPGFFLGFGLTPWLTSLGVPTLSAYIAGPLIGGVAWWAGGLIYETAFPKLAAKFSFSSLTRASWSGYFFGLTTQFLAGIFGIALPNGWLLANTLLFAAANLILTVLNINLGAIISSAITGAVATIFGPAAAAAIASAIAGLSVLGTVLAIGTLVVGTVVVFFVVVSSFWVPFTNTEGITSTSECFELEVTADKSNLETDENVTTCATYTVLLNPLLLNEPVLSLAAEIDGQVWIFNNNSFTQDAVDASRQRPGQSMTTLISGQVNQYNNRYSIPQFPYLGGGRGSPILKVNLSVLGDDDSNGLHNGGKTLAELAQDFPDLQNIPTDDTEVQYQIDEIQAQINVINYQIQVINNLLDELNITNSNLDESSTNISAQLQTILADFDTILNNNSPSDLLEELTRAQEALTNCNNQACQDHYNTIIFTYQSWADTLFPFTLSLQLLINTAQNAETQNPTNPDYTQTRTELNQLIQDAQTTISDLETTKSNLENAIDQLEQLNPSQEYFYVEGNTIYQVCWQATYKGSRDDLASQSVEITANQAYVWGLSQPYCRTIDTVYFNQ